MLNKPVELTSNIQQELNHAALTEPIRDHSASILASTLSQQIRRSSLHFKRAVGQIGSKIKRTRIYSTNTIDEADEEYENMKRDGRITISLDQANDQSIFSNSCLLPPDRPLWDMMMALLVCYYAISTPINICFDNNYYNSERTY